MYSQFCNGNSRSELRIQLQPEVRLELSAVLLNYGSRSALQLECVTGAE
jgi:uncharacterized phage-associated protein